MEKPRCVGDIYDIFITEDMRFSFLARKPNLISSEFWGKPTYSYVGPALGDDIMTSLQQQNNC
jgi:hypothetical protein